MKVTIDLPLDMELDHSEEAYRQMAHAVETINQRRGILRKAQQGQLTFLAKAFNKGGISIPELEKALKVIILHALNMAKKN